MLGVGVPLISFLTIMFFQSDTFITFDVDI